MNNEIKDFKELNKFKNYNVKVVFRELKSKKGEVDYQMLLYFDKDLVYTTKKGSFKLITMETRKLKSIKKYWFDWKNFDDWITEEYEVLCWEEKALKRFSNWTKCFRICTKINKAVSEEKEKQFKRKLNL